MNFTAAIKSVFSQYATFSGRARRSEFWNFYLFNFIAGLLIGWIPVIGWIYSIAVLIPSLAVSARRLHDTGRSAWNLLWMLLPIIGTILLIVFYVQDSKEDNVYGPNPKK